MEYQKRLRLIQYIKANFDLLNRAKNNKHFVICSKGILWQSLLSKAFGEYMKPPQLEVMKDATGSVEKNILKGPPESGSKYIARSDEASKIRSFRADRSKNGGRNRSRRNFTILLYGENGTKNQTSPIRRTKFSCEPKTSLKIKMQMSSVDNSGYNSL